MEIVNCSKIEVKPTSYSLIISTAEELSALELSLKVNQQSLIKFASIMPLLIPANRKMFENVSFWLDIPTHISRYSQLDTLDLSAKQVKFKVSGNDMICWVEGYSRGIKTTVIEFIQMVNELYKTIAGHYIDPRRTASANGESKQGIKHFRTGGVKVPNNFAPYVMAAWDDELCVVSNYHYTPGDKLYKRFSGSVTKFFRLNTDGCWTMTDSVPFLNRTLLEASASFKAY